MVDDSIASTEALTFSGWGLFLMLLVAAQSQEIRWQFGWQFRLGEMMAGRPKGLRDQSLCDGMSAARRKPTLGCWMAIRVFGPNGQLQKVAYTPTDYGRVLINAQIAAPLFTGQAPLVVQIMTRAVVDMPRSVSQHRGHSQLTGCAMIPKLRNLPAGATISIGLTAILGAHPATALIIGGPRRSG